MPAEVMRPGYRPPLGPLPFLSKPPAAPAKGAACSSSILAPPPDVKQSSFLGFTKLLEGPALVAESGPSADDAGGSFVEREQHRAADRVASKADLAGRAPMNNALPPAILRRLTALGRALGGLSRQHAQTSLAATETASRACVQDALAGLLRTVLTSRGRPRLD